jgi:hypothetical protein
LEKVVAHILESWVKRDGSFRSRKLHLGWDNVPMHRWGQAQIFRALAFYLREFRGPRTDDGERTSKERGRRTEGGEQKIEDTEQSRDGGAVEVAIERK